MNILFIDGAYLRQYYDEFMQTVYGETPPIAYSNIAIQVGANRSYYYDAIDYIQDSSESLDVYNKRLATLEAEHEYIDRLEGFHVRDGRVRQSPKKRNREQKGVDVQLAVDAM